TTPTHRQWMLFPLTTPQVPDCIEDVQTDATRSQTVTNLNIYDLTGRRVASDNTGKANLAKGIYIMNGKKVVIP
ncbi:MAG: T9SS type A sorting domain-containing protein, partial [Bacteroidaceae bacterium]|nr:T9SS type A sorting domain-containing protein [Bacteroidaceae bacterium]